MHHPRRFIAIAVLGTWVESAGPAITAAEPDPNLADLSVLRGTRAVTHRSGEKVTGPLLTAAADGVSLTVAGATLTIPDADVRRITRQGDSLKNGALWGLAIGAAIGAATVATCETNCDGEFPAGAVIGIGSLYGAGLGTLVDWLVPGSTTVYRARGTAAHVVPIMRRGVIGVAVDLKYSNPEMTPDPLRSPVRAATRSPLARR